MLYNYIYSSTDHVPIEKHKLESLLRISPPAAWAKGLIPRPRRPI